MVGVVGYPQDPILSGISLPYHVVYKFYLKYHVVVACSSDTNLLYGIWVLPPIAPPIAPFTVSFIALLVASFYLLCGEKGDRRGDRKSDKRSDGRGR